MTRLAVTKASQITSKNYTPAKPSKTERNLNITPGRICGFLVDFQPLKFFICVDLTLWNDPSSGSQRLHPSKVFDGSGSCKAGSDILQSLLQPPRGEKSRRLVAPRSHFRSTQSRQFAGFFWHQASEFWI